MTPCLHLLAGAAIVAWPALASAQIHTLAKTGDTVPGVGAITRIDHVQINDAGQWRVVADTHVAESVGQVLFREGFVLLAQQGEPMIAPVGTTLWAFIGISLNANGDVSGTRWLTDAEGWHDDSGVYWNDVLVMHEGAISTSPAFSPGTRYTDFFSTHLDASNRITLMTRVDDPAIPTGFDHALVVFEVAPDGALQSETVIAKEGDVLPGQTEAIATIGSNPHSLAANDAGSVMFVVSLTGDPNLSGAVYVDDTLVAQEGKPSPIPGRNWRTLLTQTTVDLNASGVWVLCARLDGDQSTDEVVMASHGVVAQEGHPLTAPGLEGFVYLNLGGSPLHLTDDGRVLHHAEWNDPDTSKNEGLFLDGELLVQEGVTTVDGVVIQTLNDGWDGFAISPNGKYVVFRARLANGTEGVFMLATPETNAEVESYAGCWTTGASLGAPAGPPVLGGSLKLQTSTTTYAATLPFLVFALAPLDVGGGCGLSIPGVGGELLIDATAPLVYSSFLAPFTGAPVQFTVPLADDPALMGLELYAQVLMIDAFLSAAPFELSNGVHLKFGH